MLSAKKIFIERIKTTWLRPERALWYACELEAVAKLLPVNWPNVVMEYGCLDGLSTFTMLGGEVDEAYDEYLDIDIDNEKKYVDRLDSFKDIKQIFIKKYARNKIQYGLSNKSSHLSRARRLNMYENLRLVVSPSELPIGDNASINLILAPTAFISGHKEFLNLLKEFNRLLVNGGEVILILPDIPQKDSFFKRVDINNAEVLNILDAGVFNILSRHSKTKEAWEDLFQLNGFVVSGYESFLPKIVNDFYQVGFRPMIKPLVMMHQELMLKNPGQLAHLKKHWIETLNDFIFPILEQELGNAGDHLWHAFKLKK